MIHGAAASVGEKILLLTKGRNSALKYGTRDGTFISQIILFD
jgi:hypothetical protein